MTRGRLVVFLVALGAAGLLAVTILAVIDAGRATEATQLVSETARLGVAVEGLIAERADLMESLVGIFEEGAEAEEFEPTQRLWSRLQAELRRSGNPSGAALQIYEGEPGEAEAEIHLLLHVMLEDAAAAAASELPASLLNSEFSAFVGPDEPPEDMLWFSTGGDGGPRLHCLRMFSMALEEGDEAEEDGEEEEVDEPADEGKEAEEEEEDESEGDRRIFLIHLSTGLPAPRGARLVVLCDTREGHVAPDLPTAVARGSLPADEVRSEPIALEPEVLEGRRPLPDDRVRLQVFQARPSGSGVLPPLLAWLAVAALITAGVLSLDRPRRAPPAAPDLSGEAAHEMRTPLTVMRGKLEVALRRERDTAYYRRTLHECLDEVDGLERLQDAILLLTRTRRGDLSREIIDLRAILRAEAQRVQEANVERTVSLSAKGTRPAFVAGDPSLLARALGNLLDNAARHSIAGGDILVTLETAPHQVRIVVEDDGPGVPVERHDLIFQRFFRGPDVGRRGIAGCGLGLPIVRRVAELHGGSVRVDPRATSKGRFVMVLPRDDAADIDDVGTL